MDPDDQTLLALVPPLTPRASWTGIIGILKLARGAEIALRRSEMRALDVQGTSLATLSDAFESRGTTLRGPGCWLWRERRARPPGTQRLEWRLDDRTAVAAATHDGALCVTYLALQVPVPDDIHLVAQLLNTGTESLDLVRAVRQAALWVDGERHVSSAGWHWDGPSRLEPGGATTRCLSLADFPGAPRAGRHEMRLEVLGERAPAVTVCWRGEPWSGPGSR